MKKGTGFTLIEMLVVIAIFMAVMFLTFYFFSGLNKKESLEKDVASLTALIRTARLQSVASKNASPFGIHLETGKAVLFEGSTYAPGGPNEKNLEYSSQVQMTAHSLNSGGDDIIFARLLGNTLDHGTVTLSLKDGSDSKIITVLETGVIQ